MEAKNNTNQCTCKMEIRRYRKQTYDYQGNRESGRSKLEIRDEEIQTTMCKTNHKQGYIV